MRFEVFKLKFHFTKNNLIKNIFRYLSISQEVLKVQLFINYLVKYKNYNNIYVTSSLFIFWLSTNYYEKKK